MSSDGPLSGTRVVEFSQAIAGPTAGKYMAAMGAEVVKVEDPKRPDAIRTMGAGWLPPETPEEVRRDTGPMANEFSSGKLSLGLDITTVRGRQLLEELVRWSDVFLINYSAEAIRHLKLTYEDMKAINPRIVHCALPGFGMTEDAPYVAYRAWGPNQAPIAGIDFLTGWPDRAPSGIGNFSYPDFTGGCHAALSIISALLYRDATGEGQGIDMSQFEVAVAAIGHLVMEAAANDARRTAPGTRVEWAAPHGVYPAWGRERWVAIACHDDEQWDALCAVARGASFATDPRFTTFRARLEHANELDAGLAEWTVQFTSRELTFRLQGAGVPAGTVADQADLLMDPQLEAREGFVVKDHARFGKDLTVGFPVKMSGTPLQLPRAAPSLGEHTAYIVDEVLGLGPEERQKLVEEGTLIEMGAPEYRFRRPYVDWVRHVWRSDDWPEPE